MHKSPTKRGTYVDRMRFLRYGECGKQLLYFGSIARFPSLVKWFSDIFLIFSEMSKKGRKLFLFLSSKILDFGATV